MNTNETFLPTNYVQPVVTGNYMKLEDGDNLFRALSSVTVGYQYWTTDNKPVRLTERPQTTPTDIRLEKDGKPTKIKHFWAFIVWNYKAKKIQVLEITQSSIQEAINNLVNDEDWGSPKKYDIKINRTGEGLDTVYSVNPKPHTPLNQEIANEFANTPYDLANLFIGGEVFDVRTSDGSAMPKF